MKKDKSIKPGTQFRYNPGTIDFIMSINTSGHLCLAGATIYLAPTLISFSDVSVPDSEIHIDTYKLMDTNLPSRFTKSCYKI